MPPQNTYKHVLSAPQTPLYVHLWWWHTRDEHGSGLKPILVGSGLDRTAMFLKFGGSGLDGTEKIFFVLMRTGLRYIRTSISA